jgi:hypothetical protein
VVIQCEGGQDIPAALPAGAQLEAWPPPVCWVVLGSGFDVVSLSQARPFRPDVQ